MKVLKFDIFHFVLTTENKPVSTSPQYEPVFNYIVIDIRNPSQQKHLNFGSEQ